VNSSCISTQPMPIQLNAVMKTTEAPRLLLLLMLLSMMVTMLSVKMLLKKMLE